MSKSFVVTVGYRREELAAIRTNARSAGQACDKALKMFDRGGIETDYGDTDGATRIFGVQDAISCADLTIPPIYAEAAAEAELPPAITEAAKRLNMRDSTLAKQLERGGIADLIIALREIKANQPSDEPEPEDYTDTEDAYNNGHDVAAWEAGIRASRALTASLGEN